MAYVTQVPVGPEPTTMICPHCQNHVTSNVDVEPTAKTHLAALILCVLGCCLCAPCVYCADDCQAKRHTCPQCHQFLGLYDN